MSTSDNMYRRSAYDRPSVVATCSRPARTASQQRDRRAVKAYLAIGAFCAVFSFIYAQFSHGVYSPFMTYMCLIPFVGGAVVFAVLGALRAPTMSRLSFNAYNSAIATFTIGSVLEGIFEIAGTASVYTPVFPVAGIVFLIAAGIGAFAGGRPMKHGSHLR